MKKRIQNYLSGNNEGFSLVELIIVIAIMAILIGVVALAVIPNLERSRESKDLDTLQTCASGLSVAVANAGKNASSGSIVIKADGSSGITTGAGSKVADLLEEQFDPKTISLSSSVAGAVGEITLTWDTTKGSNVCKATVDGAKDAKYAKDSQGNPAKFEVVAANKEGTGD